ncbi:hypothetical protein TanjilG_18061 [Lupinus angustifolius]|uniref:Uncharacterized protein n=1 Tax=Lupinus angustifolius TaxID=3871 RepID=A0A1J7GVI4_LUPAN|nr:hypothetical protein TanjilG_18061 [Lupinus angustifolius]
MTGRKTSMLDENHNSDDGAKNPFNTGPVYFPGYYNLTEFKMIRPKISRFKDIKLSFG